MTVSCFQVDEAGCEKLKAAERELGEDKKKLVNFILRTSKGSMGNVCFPSPELRNLEPETRYPKPEPQNPKPET